MSEAFNISLKWKVSWRKEDCGIPQQNKAVQVRGALHREEGDAIREYDATHVEDFLSSWLREDGKSKTKEDKEVRDDVCEKGKEAWRKKEMKRLSRENVFTPFRLRPSTCSAKVNSRGVIRVVSTLTVSRGSGGVHL